jgi:LacI family transcriptional regulator
MSMTRSNASSVPTVRDVAALAGVSPMTVSRTMSGGLNVRPEVQERVREAVEQLGYRPNQSARNTRLSKPTGLIGIAVTNLGNPYYGQFALGVEDVAAAHGRHIVVGNSGEEPERESTLLADFAARQLEGVILVPAGKGGNRLGARQLGGVPLVLATRTVDGLACDAVLVDDVDGAVAGTSALLADGHLRIAFLGDVEGISTAQRRFEGFMQALSAAGISLRPEHLVAVRETEAAAQAVSRLLAGPNPPTAFFSANNRTTVGALRAICEWRSVQPQKGQPLSAQPPAGPPAAGRPPVPALASFDDVELADLLGIPLTVMSHDPRKLGAAAARLLFERLAGTATPGAARPAPRLVLMPVTVRRY